MIIGLGGGLHHSCLFICNGIAGSDLYIVHVLVVATFAGGGGGDATNAV